MVAEANDKIAVKQEEAARMMGVTSRTFRNWEKKNLVAGKKIGGVKLYPVEELKRMLDPERK